MFQYFGALCEKLRRVRIGPIELGKMAPTDWRTLEPKEMNRMLALLRPAVKKAAKKKAKKRADPKST